MNEVDFGKIERLRLPFLDLLNDFGCFLSFPEVDERANVVGSAVLNECQRRQV